MKQINFKIQDLEILAQEKKLILARIGDDYGVLLLTDARTARFVKSWKRETTARKYITNNARFFHVV